MSKIKLSGGWKLLQDVYDSGEMLQIYRPGWNPTEKMEQCFSEWEPIERLVHLQLIYSDKPYFGRELRYFNAAPWWYKNEFTVSEDAGGSSAFLRLEGVDYFCRVWLNGQYLGEHEGYFSPFEFEVGDLIKYGSPNLLIVKVWSPPDEELVQIKQMGIDISIGARFLTSLKNMVKGTYEHADGFFQRDINPVGICGEVSLNFYDRVRFNGEPVIRTFLEKEYGNAAVSLQIPVYAAGEDIPVTCRYSVIDEETGLEQVSVVSSETLKKGSAQMDADLCIDRPKLWNCWERGNASLYALRIEILHGEGVLCSAARKFGIREIKIVRNEEETGFVLNGKKIFIRGVSYFPDVYLSRMGRERYDKDLRAMKQSGCNAVRVHVHVAKPAFYELCDELGMLVVQDSDLTWFHPVTEEFTGRAVGVFGDMVRLLRNHPSVICWICLNEPELWKVFKARGIINPDQDPVSLMDVCPGPQLVEELRRLDPTRPYIKGSHCKNDPESGDEHDYTDSLTGEHTHYTDIYGKSYKLTTEFGFDAPAAAENLAGIPELYKRLKPVLEDEKGLESLHDYQCRFFKYVMEYHRITKYRPCSGYFQFLFTDVCPQSFYGIYDWWGVPKKSVKVMDESNQPLGIFMEHTDKPVAIWVVNDLPAPAGVCNAEWFVCDAAGREIHRGVREVDIREDCAVRAADLSFEVRPGAVYRVSLLLQDRDGKTIAKNIYNDAFNHPAHPRGHPNRLDQGLGMRVYWA
jgi:hypothetical protein